MLKCLITLFLTIFVLFGQAYAAEIDNKISKVEKYFLNYGIDLSKLTTEEVKTLFEAPKQFDNFETDELNINDAKQFEANLNALHEYLSKGSKIEFHFKELEFNSWLNHRGLTLIDKQKEIKYIKFKFEPSLIKMLIALKIRDINVYCLLVASPQINNETETIDLNCKYYIGNYEISNSDGLIYKILKMQSNISLNNLKFGDKSFQLLNMATLDKKFVIEIKSK